MAWPFWAPTPAERIEAALDLAGLQAGERFVDLGCGDGRVLVVAARRGARVTGIEIDDRLAADARTALDAAGLQGNVVVADLLDHVVDADVVFAYLSPATLQAVGPRLTRLRQGARVVTVGYGIPGYASEASHDQCFLYRSPLQTAPRDGRPGWPAPGLMTAASAGRSSLVAVRLRHPPGPVVVSPSPELDGLVTTRAGVEHLHDTGDVVVDLVWEARPAGTRGAGALECDGVGALRGFFVYTDGDPGVWHVDEDGCAQVERILRDDTRDAEALLDVARAARDRKVRASSR